MLFLGFFAECYWERTQCINLIESPKMLSVHYGNIEENVNNSKNSGVIYSQYTVNFCVAFYFLLKQHLDRHVKYYFRSGIVNEFNVVNKIFAILKCFLLI